MVVVKNDSGMYGVKKITDNGIGTLIGEKYKSISFDEAEEEFID